VTGAVLVTGASLVTGAALVTGDWCGTGGWRGAGDWLGAGDPPARCLAELPGSGRVGDRCFLLSTSEMSR